MSWYRHRVERDLKRWQAAGWVDETGAAAIQADLKTARSPFSAAPILAILGAVLFGFAVMSFVAANWSAMSKLARLLLLLVALWGCYGAAGLLIRRQLQAFSGAAILGGIAVYGASIMLIAQMYHMEGNPPDAVFIWALGALLAAVLLQSNAALAAAFVLISVWTCWERGLAQSAHWPFLIVWAVATAAAVWMRWRPGLHLAALSLVQWLVPLGYLLFDHHAHWIVLVVGAAVAIGSAAAAPSIDRVSPISGLLFCYGLITAFAGLYNMQFIEGRILYGSQDVGSIQRLVLLAILALAMLLGAMLWALSSDNRGALWLAYTGFAIEIFTLYVRTFGTLLNTSLFFLVAALLVSGLAWAAYRLHQRKGPTGAAA
jgi:uncharacterized membrane protein